MICPWGCLLAKSTFYCPCIPQFSTALESLFFTVTFDAKRNFWFPCRLFGEMIQKPLLLNRDNNAKHLVLPYSVLCLDKHLLAWHKVRTVGWHKQDHCPSGIDCISNVPCVMNSHIIWKQGNLRVCSCRLKLWSERNQWTNGGHTCIVRA